MVPSNNSQSCERTLLSFLLACDNAYAMPLATTLRSIVDSNSSCWPLQFYILSDNINEETQRKVLYSLPKGSSLINWIAVDLRLFAEFTTAVHISKITYARLMMPEVLPVSVKKVLYLDSDILVLSDLRPLWKTYLNGAVLGAVTDVLLDGAIKLAEPSAAGVPRVQSYFNAGVLLIDLDRWRHEQITDKALDYLMHFSQSPYSDQDALNVACDRLWKKLNPFWNFQNHSSINIAKIEVDQRPGIVHFVSMSKPWIELPDVNSRFYDTFRSRTCFARNKRERLQDALKALRNRLKRVVRRCALLARGNRRGSRAYTLRVESKMPLPKME